MKKEKEQSLKATVKLLKTLTIYRVPMGFGLVEKFKPLDKICYY
jgi:hypothetical protein